MYTYRKPAQARGGRPNRLCVRWPKCYAARPMVRLTEPWRVFGLARWSLSAMARRGGRSPSVADHTRVVKERILLKITSFFKIKAGELMLSRYLKAA